MGSNQNAARYFNKNYSINWNDLETFFPRHKR